MSELETRASIAYADLKKSIIGKLIRTVEYEFSNVKLKTKTRSDLTTDEKNKFLALLTILESDCKNEIKSMDL